MPFSIKAIHQNDDGFNNVEKVSGFVSKNPTLALRHLCLYASVSAVEKLNLKKEVEKEFILKVKNCLENSR